MELENIALLKELVKVRGVASDEGRIKDFILKYVETHRANWKCQPVIVDEPWLQDNIDAIQRCM